MVYVLVAILVAAGAIVVGARLAAGWRRRNMSSESQSRAKTLVAVGGGIVFLASAWLVHEVETNSNERQSKAKLADHIAKINADTDARNMQFATNRGAIIAKIKELRASGNLTDARAEADKWRGIADTEITSLIAELEAQKKDAGRVVKIAELEAIVKGTKESDTLTKRNRYEELVALDPQNKEYKQKFAYYQKQLAAEEEKLIRTAKAQKKKEGVRVGMSKQDVLDSHWGRPQSVNATTYAWGTKEQWVYGGSNYLYFEGDTLTTIQTGR